MVEKGKRKWVRIINIYTQLATLYIHVRVSMRLKKGETRKKKFFEFKKEEYRDRQHA